jgi:hypothetical protein
MRNYFGTGCLFLVGCLSLALVKVRAEDLVVDRFEQFKLWTALGESEATLMTDAEGEKSFSYVRLQGTAVRPCLFDRPIPRIKNGIIHFRYRGTSSESQGQGFADVSLLWFFKKDDQYIEGARRISYVISDADPKDWKEGKFEFEYPESVKFPYDDLHNVALRFSLCELGIPGVLKGDAVLDIAEVRVEVVE